MWGKGQERVRLGSGWSPAVRGEELPERRALFAEGPVTGQSGTWAVTCGGETWGSGRFQALGLSAYCPLSLLCLQETLAAQGVPAPAHALSGPYTL